MKLIVGSSIVILLFLTLSTEQGLFIIQPQPIELKQWVFILITIAIFAILLSLNFLKAGKWGLALFFFSYPFLSQSTNYLNISSAYFIVTPALLYLIIYLFLRKEVRPTLSLILFLLFGFSILISVVFSNNVYTATAFFVLSVGCFVIIAYITYAEITSAPDPAKYLWVILFSIILGSLTYFVIETLFFGISPTDIPKILLRRWSELPQGRYYTGGYREPVGLAFVYSFIFWIVLYYLQKGNVDTKRKKMVAVFLLLVTLGILLISGTRTVIFTMMNTYLAVWVLRHFLGVRHAYRVKPIYIILLASVVGISAYLLLPRTILISRSSTPPSWIEPTYVSVFGNSYQLVRTTASYYNRTFESMQDFISQPLGSGPLNAPIPEESNNGGLAYYYSFLSNLIVVGATFGWVSLALWVFFIFYITYRFYRMRKTSFSSKLYSLGIVLLALIIATSLPGSAFLGPMLNWSNFNYDSAISDQITGIPAEYPSILSGFIIGVLLGIMNKMNIEKLNRNRN